MGRIIRGSDSGLWSMQRRSHYGKAARTHAGDMFSIFLYHRSFLFLFLFTYDNRPDANVLSVCPCRFARNSTIFGGVSYLLDVRVEPPISQSTCRFLLPSSSFPPFSFSSLDYSSYPVLIMCAHARMVCSNVHVAARGAEFGRRTNTT